ncbi:MAG: TRAP transporter small permease [Desulfobacterales bacterium]
MNRWYRLDDFIARVEHFVIIILLSGMILFAFLQIVLRNFFATGIAWGDPFVRYLVVWVGFIGAALATREGKHINIEIVSHWLSESTNRYVRIFSHLFSACICGLLTFAALKFVLFEAQMESRTFFALPAWAPQVIIPVTFAIMTLRFTLQFGIGLFTIVRPGFNPEPDWKK